MVVRRLYVLVLVALLVMGIEDRVAGSSAAASGSAAARRPRPLMRSLGTSLQEAEVAARYPAGVLPRSVAREPASSQPPLVRPRAITLPVLMYHGFTSPAGEYEVPIPVFREQLDWLKSHGYRTVTLPQVYAYMFGRGRLPRKPVLITMDDGRLSQLAAIRELRKRGMRAVLFVMGGGNQLDWAQLRKIKSWGFEIESHTMTHPLHPPLTKLSSARLWYELYNSRRVLRQRLGVSARYLAYPGGAYDARVVRMARKAGYVGALGAWGGGRWTPAQRFSEPRMLVRGDLSVRAFGQLVRSMTSKPAESPGGGINP